MIISFSHKGLQELFEKGKTKHLPQERIKKIKGLLTIINTATIPRDFHLPKSRTHKLKKNPYIGFWSIDVSGNYRIIFKFENGNATDVNYLDTH